MKNINKFLIEGLSIEDLDKKTLKLLKNNIIYKLGEYRLYILNNIVYNTMTNKIEYKDFSKIDVKTILRELNNEFTNTIVEEINIEAFLRSINQILTLRKRNTKRKIREAFDEYRRTIEDRVDAIKYGEEKSIDKVTGEGSILTRKQYESEKYEIQVELAKLQKWVIENKKKVAIVFEGKDASGKGSTIKRFIEYLNPKGFKVVALGVPTEEESNNWFKRYEKHLPKSGEIIFFDRSWYNRGVIEPAMGYCTEEKYNDFMENVLNWEHKLITKKDIILIKFWFSITKETQIKRFELREKSPLKYWKLSPNDLKVIDKWDIISKFKNQMFLKTSDRLSPWVIIQSNDKKIGRLNAMRYVLSSIDYDNKNVKVCKWYPEVISIVN